MAKTAKFSSKDLVYVGIFAAVYIILFFGIGSLGALNPAMNVVGVLLAVLVNGSTVMVFLTKVRHSGALFLQIVLYVCAFVLTGHPWTAIPMAIVFGGLAEWIASSGHYRNLNRNIIAYALMSLIPVSAFFSMIYPGGKYVEDVAKQMGEQYATAMKDLYTPGFVGIVAVLLFLVGLAGGFIGKLIVQRNFAKFDADAAAAVAGTDIAAAKTDMTAADVSNHVATPNTAATSNHAMAVETDTAATANSGTAAAAAPDAAHMPGTGTVTS